jgi:DNA-binding transcriptional LysR family regulator
MSISNEALATLLMVAEQGSFSAAARALGKRQSTISECIANLEIDLGVSLFDRRTRQPQLTAAGARLLPLAQQALAAQDQLQLQARALAAGSEPRLTLVLSDTFHTGTLEAALQAFAAQFAHTELECLVGEQEDVLALVREGRAQLGLLSGVAAPGGLLASQALPQPATTSLYVAPQHALARLPPGDAASLQGHRQLRLNTYSAAAPAAADGCCWYAPSYLLLLEMTQLGFGWAELPDWLVARCAPELVPLALPGWPQQRVLHAVWRRSPALGPAAAWMLQQFLTVRALP